jgi:hypothetical protein
MSRIPEGMAYISCCVQFPVFYSCDDQIEKHTIGLNIGFYLKSERFGSGFLKPKHKNQLKPNLYQ